MIRIIQLMFILNRLANARPGAAFLTAFALSNNNYKYKATYADAISPENNLQNPILIQGGLPKFNDITGAHVESSIKSCLAKLKIDFNDFETELSKSQSTTITNENHLKVYDYDGVFGKLEQIKAPLSYSWGVVNHLLSVRNDDELRNAHKEIQPSVVEMNQKLGQSLQLFEAVQMLKDKKYIWEALDEAQRRVILSSIKKMEAAGVGLPKVQREEFNKIGIELSSLSTKFSNNVLDATKAFKLLLTDKSDVDGLPDSAKGLAAQQAVAGGHENATAEFGPWLITLDGPMYLPCMQHMKNRSIRETLYRAYLARASQGDADNSDIIRRILKLKQMKAKMLGYANFAELSLSSKMAPSVDSVLQLTKMLREKSFPAAEKELEELKSFAARSEGKEIEIALWDVPYWSERLRESKYEYKAEDLKPYFAINNVLSGLFGLAERLFGVVVEAADGEEQVWEESVRFFKIKDKISGEHIASFFLDPYSRPANKRGGAWMDVCVGRSRVLQRKPVAYLVCNGSPPVGDKPSLMTFSEVETLFHEFGHGLQHMLTRIEHADAAGINNVEWDAVELPSQFMENWCYDKATLYGFAKHYETGEPLPDDLFQKVKAAKDFNAGLMMLRQLFYGALDMALHSSYDPDGVESPFDVQQSLAPLYTVLPILPDDRFLCSFGHIFAGGYSAGYYSYKWAEVMSADAFAAFEEVGLDNEDKVQETGRRFRETVLALGGGKHPSEVFRSFRGRDPSPHALLRHSGLVRS